jgi:hypothetical protein
MDSYLPHSRSPKTPAGQENFISSPTIIQARAGVVVLGGGGDIVRVLKAVLGEHGVGHGQGETNRSQSIYRDPAAGRLTVPVSDAAKG